jgi:stress-induced morphogen
MNSPSASRTERIRSCLTQAFDPVTLDIKDDSARHAGHSGAAAGGETHYQLVMVSRRFEGMSRVARSRAVHEALKDEFSSGLHALNLALRTPEEQ